MSLELFHFQRMYWLCWILLWLLNILSCATAPEPELWKCPEIKENPIVECSCDMPHTLRCTGDRSALEIIGRTLRSLDSASVSLLDCTVQNVSYLQGSLLEGVTLHGLVISSGEIKDVQPNVFQGLAAPLQALGLPNNQLASVPIKALKYLPELDRLDLSGNRLKSLDAESFKGLHNLSFIDASNNIISKISPGTFSKLPQLKTLRLRQNHLSIGVVSKLNQFVTLEELDVSSNIFIGPLDSHTFPKMQCLKTLQLSYNSFSSIRMGTLVGINNLTALLINHNQIDVIEDHAFIHLATLLYLDLSHNRIVAVSGASLAHLPRLIDLDLRHNFLRALTADLVVPLRCLQNLRLDDNDISIVASDALKSGVILKRLTLLDNPLNCDCSLSEFANWLSNSSLPREDKASAVCATPPTLENGLLADIPVVDLLCGDDEQEVYAAPLAEQVRGHVNLKSFNYDGRIVRLEWAVDDKAIPYLCDAIFVYEEESTNEVLQESTPLKCNSSGLSNPHYLSVEVPSSSDLVRGRRYRYCVVLMESNESSDDLSLVLGCSDVIPLHETTQSTATQENVVEGIVEAPNITQIYASIKEDGLKVNVAVVSARTDECQLNVAVFRNGGLLAQKILNCNSTGYVFEGLCDSSYKVCANVVHQARITSGFDQKPVCVKVVESGGKVFDISVIGLILIMLSLTTGISFVTIVWVLFKNSRPKITTHQCFMPPSESEEHQQHNKYIKLQATTKL